MSFLPPPATDPYGPEGDSAWLGVDWQAHTRWLVVGGTVVNVVALGPGDAAGPPLVFVHGLSGSWQNWLENLPFFAAERRVLAIDLPGFGASPMPAGERISIPFYAGVVAELLEVLGVGAAVLVGNSMGGFVALELAVTRPERVAALVLVSPAGLDARKQRREGLLGALRRVERVVLAGGAMIATHADAVARRARLRRLTMQMAVHRPERLPNALMSEQIRQGNGKPGFVDALDALTDHDVSERLGTVACPTLVYWGRQDRLVPVRDAARYVQLIPGARAVVLDDTGHMAMLERPGRFNADVAAFLGDAGL